jgi:exodeoxyribonuclease V alpha subunit
VEFNERQVMYDFDKLNELTLAYAISVHRSQGSEYPVVVLPLHFQYWNLLNRAVFYTGLTRAKKLAIIVGQGKAAYRAIMTDGLHRYTNLQAVLAGG